MATQGSTVTWTIDKFYVVELAGCHKDPKASFYGEAGSVCLPVL
jgi:hypothetical protein